MIPKPIDEISVADIKSLIENHVSEGRQIEYKLTLPDQTYDQRKEFLADVSSFANSEGGDLIFGVRENGGVPTEIAAITLQNLDEEILRFENLIRDGISPRVALRIHPINQDEGFLVVIRITRSWNKPHRVIYRGHDKFYSRNSRGKYELDVDDLRYMFGGSELTAREIDRFVQQRIDEILNDDSFVSLGSGAKLALHIVPLDAFRPGTSHPVLEITKEDLPPLYCLGASEQINLEGHLIYCTAGSGDYLAYVEMFRNGIIESVSASMFMNVFEMSKKEIVGVFVESQILESLPKYLGAYWKLGVQTPIGICLSFVGVEEYRFSTYSGSMKIKESKPFGRQLLRLPLQIVEDLNQTPEKIMKPLFDLMWNSFGYRKSANYDDQGHWKAM